MTPALLWALLAASFVIGLAAVIRMAGPETPGGDVVTGMIRLPDPLTAVIVTLFSVAAVLFLTDLFRRALARRHEAGDEGAVGPEPPQVPAWLRTLTQVLSLFYFVVVAYLLWRSAVPLAGMIGLRQGVEVPASAVPAPGPGAPPLVTWTFGLLALAAGLGALALALWVVFGERLVVWWVGRPAEDPDEPLAAAVEESLEDLRAEADPRRAIIRCYARFERVAADCGLRRFPWFTPMEFMREALNRLPLPRAAVPVLTSLFELARFSHHPLGTAERDRALAALDDIRTALAERASDAPAG